MAQQALVIGLGQFGLALARALSHRGVEVLAIDRDPFLVQEAAEFSAQAITFDATDEDALAAAEPARRDLAVVAIGNDAREASIIATALLKQMGARHIVARATDDIMERILRLVGAHEVVNPERAFGERLATRLSFRGVIEELPLGEDLVITEVRTPPMLAGRSLVQMALPRRFGVSVVAIRRATAEGRGELVLPSPQEPIHAEDILVLVGRPGAATALLERV